MQPGLYKGAHMGRMQRPKGFVLRKEQKQDEKQDRATRMSKRVIGHPGQLEDSKTLQQAWLRYLRVNSKTWERNRTRRIRKKLVFLFARHPEAKFLQCGNIACRHFVQQRRTPKAVCTWEVRLYGGVPYVYIYIYIPIMVMFEKVASQQPSWTVSAYLPFYL